MNRFNPGYKVYQGREGVTFPDGTVSKPSSWGDYGAYDRLIEATNLGHEQGYKEGLWRAAYMLKQINTRIANIRMQEFGDVPKILEEFRQSVNEEANLYGQGYERRMQEALARRGIVNP